MTVLAAMSGYAKKSEMKKMKNLMNYGPSFTASNVNNYNQMGGY